MLAFVFCPCLGVSCMLLFTLCFFADQENGGKALASPPGNWQK
ncbi:hypothetical protein E2320_014710, partial [Naja naja]